MDRKIILEYADFERLMAKIEAIDRKLDQQIKPPVHGENEVLSRTEAMRFLRKGKTVSIPLWDDWKFIEKEPPTPTYTFQFHYGMIGRLYLGANIT